MNKTTKGNVIRIIILASVCITSAVAFLDVTVIKSGLTTSLLRIMHITVAIPEIFGAFHLCMLALCIALAIVSFFISHKVTPEQLDSTIFAFGVFFLVIEVLKQLYHLAILFPGRYNFGILPLQLCSYVLYLYILIPFLPQGKFKDALYAFSALYQTVGGCIVMVYPKLYSEVFLSIHTMTWHIAMIFIGIMIIFSRGYGKKYVSEMLPPTVVFLITAVIATILNVTLTPYITSSPQPLNLFYMSPYYRTTYIVISDVWAALGWFPALITYVLLFIFGGATLAWLVAMLVLRLQNKRKDRS